MSVLKFSISALSINIFIVACVWIGSTAKGQEFNQYDVGEIVIKRSQFSFVKYVLSDSQYSELIRNNNILILLSNDMILELERYRERRSLPPFEVNKSFVISSLMSMCEITNDIAKILPDLKGVSAKVAVYKRFSVNRMYWSRGSLEEGVCGDIGELRGGNVLIFTHS